MVRHCNQSRHAESVLHCEPSIALARSALELVMTCSGLVARIWMLYG